MSDVYKNSPPEQLLCRDKLATESKLFLAPACKHVRGTLGNSMLASFFSLGGCCLCDWTEKQPFHLQWLELTILFIPQADISRADLIDEIRRRTSEA